jgi:uncharacterized HAD superfamily protein
MSTSKVQVEKIYEPGEHLPVAFDIDGIVLDTATEMWKAIMAHLGMSWSLDKWKHYEIDKIVGVPTRTLRPVYEPVLRNHMLPPVAGATDALRNIYSLYKKPLLFITSRRAEFKQSAINSLRQALGTEVKFEVLCTGDIHEDEYRNNKLDLLREYKVGMFVEDNYLYWETYIDANIHIITLKWPWTMRPYLEVRDRGKRMQMFADWGSMHSYITRWLRLRAYREKMEEEEHGEWLQLLTRATKSLPGIEFVCDKCGYEFRAGEESFSFEYEMGTLSDTVSIKCPHCGKW